MGESLIIRKGGGGAQGLTINNSRVMNFKVALDETIEKGDFVDFTSYSETLGPEITGLHTHSGSISHSTIPVNETTVLCVVKNDLTGGVPMNAFLLTTNGTTVTKGTVVALNSDNQNFALEALVKISDGKFAIAYARVQSTSPFTGSTMIQIINVTGSTITFTTPVQVMSGGTSFPRIYRLDGNRWLYTSGGNFGNPRGKLIDIVGDTITIVTTSEITLSAGNGNGNYDIAVVAKNRFFLGYVNSSSNRVSLRYCTVSGTTINFTSEVNAQNVNSFNHVHLKPLNENSCIVLFYTSSLQGCVVNIVGSTVTPRNVVQVNVGESNFHYMTVDGPGRIRVSYQDGGASFRATTQVLTVQNQTIIVGTELQLVAATSDRPQVHSVGNVYLGFYYVSNSLRCRILNYNLFVSPTKGSVYGIANTSATGQNNIEVIKPDTRYL